MGYFITLLVLIVILYFVQLGLRRGAFPVSVALAVTALAFLIAMDFRLQMAFALRDLVSWNGQDLLAGGYFILFMVFFCLFGFFALKYPPQLAPLKRPLDVLGGGIIGALAGIALSGALALGWFGSTLNARYPVPTGTVLLRPYESMLYAYKIVGDRFPFGTATAFDYRGEMDIVNAKTTMMPRSGDGFWASSIPQPHPGLRVFIDSIKGEPIRQFKEKLKDWVRSDWLQGPIRGGTQVYGYIGKTPVYFESDAQSAKIAIEVFLPPEIASPKEGENPLVDDGQEDTMFFNDDGKRHFMKIYTLQKKESGEVCKLIALMYEKNATPEQIEKMIPPEVQFPIKNIENPQAALMNDGLSELVANHVLDLLSRCGRVIYKAKTGETKVITVTTADGEVDIKTLSYTKPK